MAYTMRSTWFVGQMVRRLRGIGGPGVTSVRTPRVNVEDLGDIGVPAPNFEQQRRIADFLDDQVTRIDNIIAARQQQIGLLDEWWATTLALTVQAPDDPLVPLWSQVWWQEGPGILAKDFSDSGLPILRIAHLRARPPSLDGCHFVAEVEGRARWGHFLTQIGDLILSGSASVGAMAVWITEPVAGAIPYTGLIRTGVRGQRLERHFMRFFFLSRVFNDQVERLQQGIGIQHWGPSHLSRVRISLPDVREQRRRVERLMELERYVTLGLDGFQESLEFLKESKKSVISAAVSGEFDVGSASGRGLA